MTSDGTSVDTPVWGAPETSSRRWGLRETLTAVGVAAVIAGLGGAAIYAATDGNSRAFGGAHQAFGPGATPGGPPGPHGGPGGGPGPAAPEDTSVHGEFVVRNGPDGYTTVVTQTGTVTAISPTSISVRSDDGFNGAYVIPPTAAGATPPFHPGDGVVVRATRRGQTMTVTNIGEAQGAAAPHRN
jgi:hypothetical protein